MAAPNRLHSSSDVPVGLEEAKANKAKAKNKNVATASLWMVGISLILFFIPLINGLIGGLVGGYKAGSVKNAMIAAILPAIVVTLGLWFMFSVLGLPLVGVIAGVAIGGWIALSDLGLFLGAAIGGSVSQMNDQR